MLLLPACLALPVHHSSRSVAPSRAAPPAMPAAPTSSGPGFGSMMMQGMALGAGSSIAHHAIGGAVNAMSGGSSAPVAEGAAGSYAAPPAAHQQQQQQAQMNMCAPIQQDLARCLETNTSDISMCQPYFDQFKSCQQQMTGGQSFM